jgi:hypothetical protein
LLHTQVRIKFTDACSGAQITAMSTRVLEFTASDTTLAQVHRLEAANALTKASLATCSHREAQTLVGSVVVSTGRSTAREQTSVAALLDDLRGQATEAVSREVRARFQFLAIHFCFAFFCVIFLAGAAY